MDLIKTNALLTLLLLLLFTPLITSGGDQENMLVKAIQLYDDGQYGEAEVILKKLLDEKPDHLMVNYYYGACRTENGHYGTNEIICLLNGSTGESPLKTDYYLGVQYHARNRWNDALKHYNRFLEKTGPEEQAEVGLSEKIQQCRDEINPFVDETTPPEADVMPVPVPRETEPAVPPVAVAADTTPVLPAEEAEPAADEETESGEVTMGKPIHFVVSSEITYLDTAHFRTREGLLHYNEGEAKQEELDARQKEVDAWREQYSAATSPEVKRATGEKILSAETTIYNLQGEINRSFLLAKQAEADYWDTAAQEEKEAFLAELENYEKAIEEVEKAPEPEVDTLTVTVPEAILIGTEMPEPQEPETEDELIYKIQIGAYSRGLPTYVKRQFDKLSYIRKIENYTDENGVVVYTTGNLTNLEDAIKMQNQVRQEGIEDAFVVPYFNGKRITLKEAKELEKEK